MKISRNMPHMPSRNMVRGACPSLDDPMQTGDGLLVRLTPEAGFFRPDELKAIAKASAECGNGIMEVSRRSNLQVRGLSAGSVHIFRTRVAVAEIVFERTIPVVVNPLAGLDGDEVTDPREMQGMIRGALDKTDFSRQLSPKVSVIVDSGSRFNLAHISGDIRLKAVRVESGVGWQFFVGGTEDSSQFLGTARDDAAAVAAVMALLKLIVDRGQNARGRDLETHDIADLNQFSGSQISGPVTVRTSCLPVGLFQLKSGAYALGVALAYGTTNADEMLNLIRDAERLGASRIEPAPAKTILISDMEKAGALSLQKSLEAFGFICDGDDPRLAIVTCAGAPACRSGFIETHPLAEEIAREFGAELAGATERDLCIHISACEKRCANPGRPAIEILGTEAGYKISNAGRGNGNSEISDAHKQLLPAIDEILKKRNL